MDFMKNNSNTEQDEFSLAVAEWRRAQVVFCSPSWKGRPLARHYCENLSSKPEFKDKLAALLSDKNQIVVAYVLLTLDLMQSETSLTVPEELFGRRDQITTMTGSFANKSEIGAFAKHLRKGTSNQVS